MGHMSLKSHTFNGEVIRRNMLAEKFRCRGSGKAAMEQEVGNKQLLAGLQTCGNLEHVLEGYITLCRNGERVGMSVWGWACGGECVGISVWGWAGVILADLSAGLPSGVIGQKY